MAVEHIQETDTLNRGRIKINEAIDLANNSSTKVDQFEIDLAKGIQDAKKIATDAGSEAKSIAETAGNEAKQTASTAATEAKTIAETAGNEAKAIAENAGLEANKKADQAIADSKTAVDNSNQAIGRANQNKQEFDALRNDFDDLVAESGDSNPEIVQARTDTQGVKQSTLQNRLIADFSTRLTNADAIQLFSGPVNVPKMMDLAGKVAGNIETNPHSVYTDYTATSLKTPSASWAEITQENYNKLVGRDDQGVSVGSSQGSVIPQQLSKFDTVKAIEQLAPRIFEGMSVSEKVKYIKDNFISLSVTTRAKASSPNNKNIKIGVFVESADSYTTKIQGDATDFTDFTTEINDSNFIDSNGFIYVLSYADSSNGVTASNINTDYIGVQLMVSLNPLTVLNKSGFANEADLALKTDQTTFEAHTTNQENPHSVTASQVGAYSKIESDNKFSEITDKTNEYTDAEVSEINSRLTAAINAVDEKATNNTNDLTNQVNNNKVLIQKNKDRIIGGYRVNDLMRKTHYSAHRGNNADFPENSSMAMKKVIRHKFSECDVQTTSDGKWVVMHDATVDRMTNGTGRVDSFTYEELRKLRIDTGNNLATLPDWEKVIPNLDEAIKYNRMAGTIPMIEIKVDEGTTYTDEELADFVNQLKLNNLDKGGCIVISFSADVLRKLRSLSETLEIMWVTYDMSDATLNTCKELRMHVDPQYSHETVTRSQIQKYHDNGLLVSVWTCPDDKFADMEDRGVDIITTNSRSGDLRWSQLTLKNGYTGVTWAGYLPPYVEEINKGLVRLSCTVTGGSNSQNTVIAELPEWAQPYLNSAGLGMVRTSSSINQCSVDVIGKIAGTPSLVVGLNWNNRTSWAMINIDYKIL